jgi:nucleotide-binding universal stress UspA family protein
MNNTTYTKIVVPLDGSPLAEVALPYAEEIAGKIGSEMVLLSVLSSEEPEEFRNHYTYMEKIVDMTMHQVKKYSDGNGNGDCAVCTATRVGNPAQGILDYVDKGHLCLVVMATHGRSGISRWAIGSVADKVVRSTTRQPLLLIRAKGAHPDVRAKRIFKKALLPLDGSTESEAVMPVITTVAASLQMEITLLRVLPRTDRSLASVENYLQEWCQRLAEKGITSRYEVRIGAPADHIIDLADESACDLVAMSTHGHAIGNLWPLGSVAQKVLLGGTTPLLLVRA